MNRTVALALGSGGARGITHIGVINWLETNGYRIHCISGASMGALVGGIYAAGKLDEYADWLRTLDRIDIIRLLDFSFGSSGLFKGDRLIDALMELVGHHRIEDLPIAYTAVASDIESGKEVWFSEGSLFDAIRASIAIPLFFTPVKDHGRLLLDGGLLNPVPIAPTFAERTDITVAVNLGGPADPDLALETADEEAENGLEKYQARIVAFIEDLQAGMSRQADGEKSLFDLLQRSFESMQGTLARMKLAAYSPDYIIEIPRNVCRSLDFHRADELIAYGEKKAAETLANLDLR